MDAVTTLVIEDLAAELALKDERIVSLEADNSVLRELLVAALDALAAKTAADNRRGEQHHRVIDEFRTLRERLLLQAGADDAEAGHE